MSREWRLYWSDMMTFCGRVTIFTKGLSRDEFFANQLVFDAVCRNLELIGEAAKNIPEGARQRAPAIEWPKIAAMRNVLAHGYFGLDDDVLWDVVCHKVPELHAAMAEVDLDKAPPPSTT